MTIRRLLLLVFLAALLLAQQPHVAVPNTSSVYAYTVFMKAAVTGATTVKSTGGNLYGYDVYNPNSSLCVLQVFNTTSPTLGTTAPILNLPFAATSKFAMISTSTALANFSSAIAIAATTAATGATACTTGMVVNLFYQ